LQVILVDEPTTSLDSHRGCEVMELFLNVAFERVSAVIVVTRVQRSGMSSTGLLKWSIGD